MSNDLETEWTAQEPSAGFAERVVREAIREQRTASRARYLVAAGALAVAVAVVVFVVTRRPPSRGEVTADRRLEVSIGSRAVAVLEPGAHISWDGDSVRQTTGEVFYRVESGADFQVQTPTATAVVLGTCFRISVNDQENVMKRRDLGAGALGAVVTGAVIVGVYEGQVRFAHGNNAVTVGAGESAVADERGVRTAQPTARTDGAPTTDRGDRTRTATELRDRIAALEEERSALEEELFAAQDAAGKHPYDLSQEDWAKMAEQGSFKYRLPCFQSGGFRPRDAQLAKLGLGSTEGDLIQAAYKTAGNQFGTTMRDVCARAYPGTNINDSTELSSCISKLFTTMYTSADGPKPTLKQVGEIRAGKRPEPKPEDTTPLMRMLLQFSTASDLLEAELAKSLGADEAHRIVYSDELCFSANTIQ